MKRATKPKASAAENKAIIDQLRQKDKAIVLFYATWCPFSRRFLPIFEDYARSNPEECMSLIIDDRPDICEEYSIEVYPTVILFKKGIAHRRIDAEPGIGLNEKQLKDLTEDS